MSNQRDEVPQNPTSRLFRPFFRSKMAVKSLKHRLSKTFKEAQFPFVSSSAMRNIMTRFVYIGRVVVPSWLTSLSS